MEWGRTDDILLLLARKVIHSCHSFLTVTPPKVHSHQWRSDPSDVRGADSRDIIPLYSVFDPDVNPSMYITYKSRSFPVTSLTRATGAGPIPSTVVVSLPTSFNPLYFDCQR